MDDVSDLGGVEVWMEGEGLSRGAPPRGSAAMVERTGVRRDETNKEMDREKR
jgi:hypothetical protein